MGRGIFGGLFDFNGDGEVSGMGQALEFALLDELLHEDEPVDADFESLDE